VDRYSDAYEVTNGGYIVSISVSFLNSIIHLSSHDTATGAYHLANKLKSTSIDITSVLGTFLEAEILYIAFEFSVDTYLTVIDVTDLTVVISNKALYNNRPKSFAYYPGIQRVFGVGCKSGDVMVLSHNIRKCTHL
jgi:hypothetical protein